MSRLHLTDRIMDSIEDDLDKYGVFAVVVCYSIPIGLGLFAVWGLFLT